LTAFLSLPVVSTVFLFFFFFWFPCSWDEEAESVCLFLKMKHRQLQGSLLSVSVTLLFSPSLCMFFSVYALFFSGFFTLSWLPPLLLRPLFYCSGFRFLFCCSGFRSLFCWFFRSQNPVYFFFGLISANGLFLGVFL
jgi:hypothetical protein